MQSIPLLHTPTIQVIVLFSMATSTRTVTLKVECFVDEHKFGDGMPGPGDNLCNIENLGVEGEEVRFLHVQLKEKKNIPLGAVWTTSANLPPQTDAYKAKAEVALDGTYLDRLEAHVLSEMSSYVIIILPGSSF